MKKWPILLGSLLAIAAIVILLSRLHKPGLIYRGLPVGRWIELNPDPSTLEKGLAEIGPESIPYLRRALHKTDDPLRQSIVWLWRRLPRSLQLKYRSHAPVEGRTIREAALWGFRFWGPEAREALPDLMANARTERDLMNQALNAHALAEVGGNSPEVLELFQRALRQPDKVSRDQAAGAMFDAGLRDPAAVPWLIESIKRSPDKPYNELLALGAIGPEAAPALPWIIGALKDPATRNNAVTALKGTGAAAKPALPTIIELVEHGELELTPQVIEVMIYVGPPASNAVPMLRAALAGQDPVARAMAAVALGRIQQHVESAVPVLIAELANTGSGKEDHWSMWLPNTHIIGLNHRQTAAWFLGETGPAAKCAVPELQKAMQSKQAWLDIAAARAVWRITGQADPVLPVLLKAAASTDETTCVLASQVLGEMGPAAEPAIPALLNARTNSLYIRRAVNEALKRIDPETAARVIHRPLRQ